MGTLNVRGLRQISPSASTAEPNGAPEWLVNFAALHSLIVEWDSMNGEWTVMRLLPAHAVDPFVVSPRYITYYKSGDTLEIFMARWQRHKHRLEQPTWET